MRIGFFGPKWKVASLNLMITSFDMGFVLKTDRIKTINGLEEPLIGIRIAGKVFFFNVWVQRVNFFLFFAILCFIFIRPFLVGWLGKG